MDFDDPAASPDRENLSLPLAVLGDLPAKGRFHGSLDAVAGAMESVAGRLTTASGEPKTAT